MTVGRATRRCRTHSGLSHDCAGYYVRVAIKRSTRQPELDEARGHVEPSDAIAGVGVEGLQLGPGVSRSPSGAVSGPPLPLPRALALADQRPFVGRVEPLRQLRERWSESLRGHGGLVAVGGEPGIGKTRLAARFAAEVRAEGGTVLCGRADAESVSPYEPFMEPLRHCAAHWPRLADEPGLETATRLLGGLIPELGRPVASAAGYVKEQPNDRKKLFEAVLQLFLHAAAQRPLLVIVEDLHWADAPTIRLLRELPRRGAGLPVLIVATYRDLEAEPPSPLAQALLDLRREGLLDRIVLQGFDRSETAALVAPRRAQVCRRRAGRAPVRPDGRQPILHRRTDARPCRGAGRGHERAGGGQGRHRPALGSTAAGRAGSADVGGRARDRLPAFHPPDRRSCARDPRPPCRLGGGGGGKACCGGSRRGGSLLVCACAGPRDALRAADREPPAPSAPARRGGARVRGRAGHGAPCRGRVSLLPGAARRWRGEGGRARLERGRGGVDPSCLRGGGEPLRARACGAGDRQRPRRRRALRRDAGARRSSLAGEYAGAKLDVRAGARARAWSRLGGPAGTGGARSGRPLLCPQRHRPARDRGCSTRRSPHCRRATARFACGCWRVKPRTSYRPSRRHAPASWRTRRSRWRGGSANPRHSPQL